MAPAPLTSGVGVANLPNQRHKIVAKRGANFTIMVCGKPSLPFHHLTQTPLPILQAFHIHFNPMRFHLGRLLYGQCCYQFVIPRTCDNLTFSLS